ncbi:MAG: RNA-directed DNA polymerase [Candidatus Saccharibacteria bacterium]|nr:RNA-directed DNA polymerase [Candidatus Saccharibacteria bacterium]
MSVENKIDEWLLRELFYAYLDARKNKRSTSDEHNFELNYMENLMTLRDDIMNHRYKPGRGIAFITYDPVMREIFAAPFRDRVVHHFIYNQVAEWWDRHFIYDSYSCRKDKGTFFAIDRLRHHVNSVSRHGTKEAYVIKLDIQGYFMSLQRKAIFERACWGLDQQFKGEALEWKRNLIKYLWREIIFDDPTAEVRRRGSVHEWDGLPDNKSLFCQPPGQGIVIGNLSSQLLSNIYLDLLDRYVTIELGYKHYGRYVDDFYIVVSGEEYKKALEDLKKIDEFLKRIGLILHPKKRYIQEVKKGVPFMGVVVYPNSIVPGKRLKRNFYKGLYKFGIGYNSVESITSHLGHMKHIDGKKFTKKMFDKFGNEYRF